MLLHREPGQPFISPEDVKSRLRTSSDGEWLRLLTAARGATPAPQRPQSQTGPSVQQRLERAAALAGLGELSAAASTLTSAPLAPGNDDTRSQLQDPARRPQVPYEALQIPDRLPGAEEFRLKRSDIILPTLF